MDFTSNDFINRFVKFTPEAKQDIKNLENTILRLGQILTGIQIFLKNSAHCGKRVSDSAQVYCYVTQKYPNAPALECYYTFDESEVRVLSIDLAEEI